MGVAPWYKYIRDTRTRIPVLFCPRVFHRGGRATPDNDENGHLPPNSRDAARTTRIVIGGGRGLRWLVLRTYGSEVADIPFQPPPPLAGEEDALVTEVCQTISDLEDLHLVYRWTPPGY